jgi:hypothetical protein
LNNTQKRTTAAVFSTASRVVIGATMSDENNLGSEPRDFAAGYEVGASLVDSSFDEWYEKRTEDRLRKAYQLGLLHGINAQSMSQVSVGVMEFEDYGWALDE